MRSRGVTGREILGVVDPDAAEGEDGSSSMVKMSSTADDDRTAWSSGLVKGEGVARPPRLVGLMVSTGGIAGLRGFHFHGCLTLGVGISWSANHSL